MNTATEAPFKSVDENYQFFKSSINDSIRNHIPQKNISGRWNVPWLTTSIKRLTRKKQTLYIIKHKEPVILVTGKSLKSCLNI